MRKRLTAHMVCVFLSLVVTLVVYSPGLGGGFALDDYTNITQNDALAVQDLSWTSLSHAIFSFQAGPTMRPVSMLSFALNRYFSGNDAYVFKLTNLIIHLLNGLLVFWLLFQLLEAYRRCRDPSLPTEKLRWLALLAGACWMLHPLNLMPVLYVVQREASLSVSFVLLGINLYLWARMREQGSQRGGWLMWSVAPMTLLATLCKESGALLPAYLLVI